MQCGSEPIYRKKKVKKRPRGVEWNCGGLTIAVEAVSGDFIKAVIGAGKQVGE